MQQRLSGPGFERISSTPDELSAFLKAEIARWERGVKVSGAQPE